MRIRAAALVTCCLALGLLAGCREAGELAIPPFPQTAMAAGSVDVTVGPMGLWLATRFMPNDDPDAEQVKRILMGLKSVRVRVYKIAPGSPLPVDALASLRRQLSGPDWSPLVQSRDKRRDEDVDVYLAHDEHTVRGLAVIVTKPEEIAVVNVIGTIDARDVGRLREMAMHARKGGDTAGWVTEH
jgi:hypothetical protein